MTSVRSRGEQIRRYITANVEEHPHHIAGITAREFGITRQAVNKHLHRLIDEKALARKGNTRNRSYFLYPQVTWEGCFERSSTLAEDVVWRNQVAPSLGQLPDNVVHIWHYGFTEMFNNAIDHSDAGTIHVRVEKIATKTRLILSDDGIGIFVKIQSDLNLLDERHAILELAKGKLTTDPENHTGEGIFFTSRMFDNFAILSGGTYFSHQFEEQEDWIIETREFTPGTAVFLKLSNHTARTDRKIFNEYSPGDEYGFSKTVVPVCLAQYGDDKLVSRSQAKRLLARIDRFRIVVLDFQDVDSIGQAFADEVFRVFPNKHPTIELLHIKATPAVERMISRVGANNGS